MDKDLIDFNSVKINSKTPNFKVTNAIIRWRNFIFIGACLILVIVLSVCFARMNSNINTKTEKINEMNGNINTNQSELQTLISSATEAKSTNEKLKVESDGYKQIIRQYKGDKKSLQSAIESYKTRMQEYGTYLSAKTEEKRIIVKEYSANKAKLDELISRNEALKKEYEELGGKPKEDITIKSSEIIKNNEQINLLEEWIGGTIGTLCYSGTRNSLNPSSFHKKCDEVGPTIVIVKTDSSAIIGGFTSLSWGGSKEKSDNTAFIFNLSNRMQFTAKSLSLGIACGIDKMPSFGEDFDIAINGVCLSQFPTNYGVITDKKEDFYPKDKFFVDIIEIYNVKK